jgi:hypothetical protein
MIISQRKFICTALISADQFQITKKTNIKIFIVVIDLFIR